MTKVSEFQEFCKPKNTSTLTPYCIELTKITQEKVDNGISFQDALQKHEDWLRTNISDFDEQVLKTNMLIVTCGYWDMNEMAPKEYINYDIKKVHDVYLKYVNIKDDFCRLYNHTDRKYGMTGMLFLLNIELEGTHHSGIDDCRNISKVLIKMFEDGYDFDKLIVQNVQMSKTLKILFELP